MTTAVRCEWIKIIPTFCQQKSFWSAKINFLVYRWILVVCVPWGEKSWKSLLYIMLHEMLLQLPDTLHRETSQKTLLRIYPNSDWDTQSSSEKITSLDAGFQESKRFSLIATWEHCKQLRAVLPFWKVWIDWSLSICCPVTLQMILSSIPVN